MVCTWVTSIYSMYVIQDNFSITCYERILLNAVDIERVVGSDIHSTQTLTIIQNIWLYFMTSRSVKRQSVQT